MILISGFKKFGRFKENISEILISTLPKYINGERIEKVILPVSWKRSISEYMDYLDKLHEPPHLVLLLGSYTGSKIHIERYSWNIMFGIDVDNAFKCGFIDFGYKLRIKSIVDLKKIKLAKSQLKDIKISNFPGYYLCNYVYFQAFRISKMEYPVIFIHLPNKNVSNRFYDSLIEIIVEILDVKSQTLRGSF